MLVSICALLSAWAMARKGVRIMKLTMVTEWNGNVCNASSRLPEKKARIQSCISQTQEFCYNFLCTIPTPAEIMEHMVEFSIDEVG